MKRREKSVYGSDIFTGETLVQNLGSSASRTLFVGALPLPDLATWHTDQPRLKVQDTAA